MRQWPAHRRASSRRLAAADLDGDLRLHSRAQGAVDSVQPKLTVVLCPQSFVTPRNLLEGLRGEENISELCRRAGIAASMYYGWSKEFLEAGKRPIGR